MKKNKKLKNAMKNIKISKKELKFLILCVQLFGILLFNSFSVAQCLTGTLSSFNSFTASPCYSAATCNGYEQTIPETALAGTYSFVNTEPDAQYTFRTSVATDYITITNVDKTIILAQGLSPLIWNSSTAINQEAFRYYIHSNMFCGSENINRTKFIKCRQFNPNMPRNLSVSSITSTSANFDWNAPLNPPFGLMGYQVYFSPSNIEPIGLSVSNVTTLLSSGTNYVLTGNTIYYYWVRAIGQNTNSDWAFGGFFLTSPRLNCNGIASLIPLATFSPTCTNTPEVILQDTNPAS